MNMYVMISRWNGKEDGGRRRSVLLITLVGMIGCLLGHRVRDNGYRCVDGPLRCTHQMGKVTNLCFRHLLVPSISQESRAAVLWEEGIILDGDSMPDCEALSRAG
jgi:hypothetical protein